MKSPAVRKVLSLLVKVGVVGALLYFLTTRGLLSMQKTREAFSHWELVLPAGALMGVNLLLGVLRWQWLLQAHDIRLKLSRTLQLSLIGNFFNLALPGAVSGDFVKAYYVGHEAQGRRAQAFGSILFDRVAGLSALVVLAAGALGIGFQHFEGTVLMKAISKFVVVAAVLVVAFYGYLFVVRENHDPLLALFRGIARRFPKAEGLAKIYESLRHYHNHRGAVLRVLAISLVIHLMVGWAFLQFARALGGEGLPLEALYVVVPLGLLVTAVPVAPAGVGTGHAAFAYLFSLIGFKQGADVFTLFTIFQLLFGGVGGVVYLWFRRHEPAMEARKADAVLLPTEGL